ncbi:hypothetical protein [Couchioplanes caeruleus]|uniref:Tat pathway signal sequence domain protein n=2 Tax=Couchioplanes caeruleus TaxID=56438 RepID=A0A1K0GPQ0_9ACTN|nr:hypothetical protein [Couchioplanes caeruleus]OJF11227.1 hypothetical protein BG844_27890 [Couchioplanes caeruleus subsp. caeruleus]OJF15969.1 hypothetical protein BG844_01690 [Couchioplanes caeruleus subsp. caeruleus]ROP27823.1 hypothetical protein EDD30_0518 [Couchioplanes caeruleus]
MGRYRKWAWGLGVATVTAVSAFGVASWQANAAPPPTPPTVAGEQPGVTDPNPGPVPATGIGSDALTAGEVDKARKVAVTPQLASAAEDVTGAKGPEYLSATIVAEGATRRAELYYYDYKAEKVIKQVVDLPSGTLAGSYSAAGVQPPASKREAATGLELLLANPLAADLKSAYQKATGRQFAGKDDVTVTAHVYKAKPADSRNKQCGQSRCLQLVVETKDGLFIDVNHLIIDLSGRTVARLA